jgi:2,4-dienoyl-CoA reductase-like NADH-dependent reductase (Old Yellow Enzyme family)
MALYRAFHILIVLLVVADYRNNPILGYAQPLKESGTKVIIASNGGFQDLDLNEEYIATGKADMISMARTWWVDPG